MKEKIAGAIALLLTLLLVIGTYVLIVKVHNLGYIKGYNHCVEECSEVPLIGISVEDTLGLIFNEG